MLCVWMYGNGERVVVVLAYPWVGLRDCDCVSGFGEHARLCVMGSTPR